MKIGLYFGSFNPVHVGHLIIANHMLMYSDMERLWFVLSPQNPFKEKRSLLDDYHRLEMLHLAIGDNYQLRASDIEFGLPRPSYTVTTLAHLMERFPEHEFGLIMGADNLQHFHRWKNYEVMLENHILYVYPRLGSASCTLGEHPHVRLIQAPIMEISSSQIRQMIRQGKNVEPLLPCGVFSYLDRNNFYR